jgi:hypothetical protein
LPSNLIQRLLAGMSLAFAAAAAAQPVAAGPEAAPAGLPPWVVPVLRLVSQTHVEPITGVVISRSGLVLVPDDFAAFGDEVVVLDGGNDIVRNGRPAHFERAFPELGLEVLRVDGLSRAPAPIAAAAPGGGDTVRLQAFPPAEQIAEGMAPVRQSATLSLSPVGGTPSIDTATPLPNVTGPLLDGCGHLAGLSLADGVQTLAPSPQTRYRWDDALRAVLKALDLPAAGVPCGSSAEAENAPAAGEPPAPESADVQPATPEAAAQPETEAGNEEPAAEETTEPDLNLEELPPHEDEATNAAEAVDASAGEVAGAQPPARHWWWLAGGLLLLAGGLAVHRLRRAPALGESAPGASPGDGEGDAGPARAGQAPGRLSETGGDLTVDARLVLLGHYADGRRLEVSAPVSADAINLEIGRGAADLPLDSAAVSRRHARLVGDRAALTIEDLGSNNGTSIDSVPCLEGEILYLEPGCTVILGDVRFSVSVEPEGGPS